MTGSHEVRGSIPLGSTKILNNLNIKVAELGPDCEHLEIPSSPAMDSPEPSMM